MNMFDYIDEQSDVTTDHVYAPVAIKNYSFFSSKNKKEDFKKNLNIQSTTNTNRYKNFCKKGEPSKGIPISLTEITNSPTKSKDKSQSNLSKSPERPIKDD